MEIEKQKWINYGRWVQPPLSGTFWCHWNKTDSMRELTADTYNDSLFLDGNTLLLEEDQKKLQKLAQYLHKENKAQLFTEHFENISSIYSDKHLALLKCTDSKNTEEYLKKLFYTYRQMAGLWWFAVAFGDELQNYILEEKIVDSEQDLSTRLEKEPRQEYTWLERQSRGIRMLASTFNEIEEDDPFVQKAIDTHVSHYSWFGTHHWMGNKYSRENCIKEIRDAIKKGDVDSVPPENTLINLQQSMMFWRTHFAEVTAKVVFSSRSQLIKCAESHRLGYDDLVFFSHQELLASFSEGNQPLDVSEVKEREKSYGCYVDKEGKENIIVGDELDLLIQNIVGVADISVKELKGTIASKGDIVQGKVTVLIAPRDFNKFKKGDVLVASETTPDFVPYMKLASAIVTDRGGVTSHAAIIARELDIPCIVGTETATQVFNCGDEVEVDTERGIVRKQN